MRDDLLVAFEVALLAAGLVGVWMLAGIAVALVVLAVVGVVVVEVKA